MLEVEGVDCLASSASGDENEYVFVSFVKKVRDILYVWYLLSVIEYEIVVVICDYDEMFFRWFEG